ncbi:MAG: hypothetical protein H6727_09390 [Myxococcales bacterium]|nr:hypothetical protein [Myxococcales bacterium]
MTLTWTQMMEDGEVQSHNQPRITRRTAQRNEPRLEGLHLTVREFARGVRSASRRPNPEARAFLAVMCLASGQQDAEGVLEALRRGWRPTLETLLDAGLNEPALRWIPEGNIQLKLYGNMLTFSSHQVVSIFRSLTEMEESEREAWVVEMARLQKAFPFRICGLETLEERTES